MGNSIGKLLVGAGAIGLAYADLAAIAMIFAEWGIGWGVLFVVVPVGWFVAPFVAGTWLVALLSGVVLVLGAVLEDMT